ncbi:sulfite oxidase, mitochondrial isoform X2 [Manduca sexta]|uniref:sulfite oxidase, mitochondrial isoform X2 n=1 Tax=Manduca sexta TaxID=7130 RepID=UPI00188F2BE9|nr:sulfite oxidase, mitochondrial isoform X2 [Manduca sexta]
MSLRNLLLRTITRKNKFINFASIATRNEHPQGDKNKYESKKGYGRVVTGAVLGSVLVGSAVAGKLENLKEGRDQVRNKGLNKDITDDLIVEAGGKRPDLPTYRAEEVSQHDNIKSFWVTYKHGVYDITKFLPSHPGGEQILNAAGLSIEPFWNVYGMHKTPEVYALLESYRVGNLHDDDVVDHSDEEMWVREPLRDRRLVVKTARPFNAEIPPKLQIQHLDTPNELFYVRQHMPVPELDPATHRVKVSVGGHDPRTFSLQQLDQFPRVTLRAALMCAGNRRSEMNKVKPVKGLDWAGGAISNATWTGLRLRDVLLQCGVDPTDTKGKHVILQGADIDATGVNFSTSIPLATALSEERTVLLVTHMNGAPLPPDHGAPLRAVVPGAPAVRSVKWLESITVSELESPSHWHQKDYRAFNPSKTWETADFSTAPPVYSLPVTSAICDPGDGEQVKVKNGHVEVKGYAYSGGGAKIMRVDISADRGATWVEAQHLISDDAPPNTHYGWTLWTARVPVGKGQSELELWAKATDSNFNTQPEKFDDIWNIRGILSNAYHKIKIKLQH